MLWSCDFQSPKAQVNLISMHAWETYGGLLEGTPNAELDKQIEEAMSRMARDVIPDHVPFCLIPPKLIEYERKVHDRAPPQKFTRLPRVFYTGWFDSGWCASKPRDGSHCGIGWFQDEFGEPDADIIRQVDWVKESGDYDY